MTTESYCRTCKRRRPDTHFETHLDHERALPRSAIANAIEHAPRTTLKPTPRPAAVPIVSSTQDTWDEGEFKDGFENGEDEIVEEIPTWKILAGLGAVGAFLVGVGVLAARVTPPPDVLARMNEERSSNIHNDTSSFPHGFSVR